MLILATVGTGVFATTSATAAQTVQPPRFEYHIEGAPVVGHPMAPVEPQRIDPAALSARLTALGAQGWELVQIVPLDPARAHFGNAGVQGQVMIFRRSNVKDREERLLALEQRLNTQVAQLQTIRQDVLDAVRNGLAASLIGEYLEPFRAQVLSEVDRRLRERLPAQP